jgi:CRISPR-associated protein Cas1
MIIIIDDYGVSIEKFNNSFKLCKGEDVRVISPNKATAFHIFKSCTISTPSILLAAEFQIPVLFFDARAKVIARLWEPGFGNLPVVRYNQLLFARSADGLQWVSRCLVLKTEGQIAVLKHCRNRLSREILQLDNAITRLPGLKEKLTLNNSAEGLRSLEAVSGKLYWQGLAAAMEQHTPFGKRTRRPAMDRFNALINYGYGMLYSVVETAALTAGLDPCIGILHAEGYKRPALVFDAIEPFRAWVDRLVADMALHDQISDELFEENSAGAIWLAKTGKKVFIPAFYEIMNEPTLFNRKRIKRKDQVQHLLTALAQYLLKEFKAPDPYA